jgi:hypothetical protein
MMENLIGFVGERVRSVISKKVAATAAASMLAAGGAPAEVTWPLVIYVIAQAAVDCFKYWVGSRS